MTIADSNFAELLATLEELRSQKHPDLSNTLVAQILEIEAYYLENQSEASKRIIRLVDTYLEGRAE